MLQIIASQYPRLCRAMRRAYGMPADDTARLILAARYPDRAAVWSSTSCADARTLFADALAMRPRLSGAR